MTSNGPITIPPIEARANALKAVLQDKGILSDPVIDGIHDLFDAWIPENGAKVVARAWTDAAFRQRLLMERVGLPNGAESGHGAAQPNRLPVG